MVPSRLACLERGLRGWRGGGGSHQAAFGYIGSCVLSEGIQVGAPVPKPPVTAACPGDSGRETDDAVLTRRTEPE